MREYIKKMVQKRRLLLERHQKSIKNSRKATETVGNRKMSYDEMEKELLIIKDIQQYFSPTYIEGKKYDWGYKKGQKPL